MGLLRLNNQPCASNKWYPRARHTALVVTEIISAVIQWTKQNTVGSFTHKAVDSSEPIVNPASIKLLLSPSNVIARAKQKNNC